MKNELHAASHEDTARRLVEAISQRNGLRDRVEELEDELESLRSTIAALFEKQCMRCEYRGCWRWATHAVTGEISAAFRCEAHAGTGYGETDEAPLIRWLEKEEPA